MILGAQKNFSDKQGIGFNPFQAKKDKTIFVKASYQKPKKLSDKPNFLRKMTKCYYCGRNGHTSNKCVIRNNAYRFKQI